MTPKQEERIQSKIKKIKAALAADKRYHGGYYDDSRGLRYLPPRHYIELNDFTGGLRYFNWFMKTFPDDSGYPDFLFEWTIVLFKKGRLKEAEKKACETFYSNTYLFDTFFGTQTSAIEKWEGSNLETKEFADNYFTYSSKQEHLFDFAQWLEEYVSTERFVEVSNTFFDIRKKLKSEDNREIRRVLIEQEQKLIDYH